MRRSDCNTRNIANILLEKQYTDLSRSMVEVRQAAHSHIGLKYEQNNYEYNVICIHNSIYSSHYSSI
jgi:hypothetical protein